MIEQELQNQIKCITANLDACKAMYNEAIQQNMNLRTNNILLQQLQEEFTKTNDGLKKEVEMNKTQLETLGKVIEELKKPKEEGVVLEGVIENIIE